MDGYLCFKLKFMQFEFKSHESTLKAELTSKMNYTNSQQKLKSFEQSKPVQQIQPPFNLDTRKRIENNTDQLETQTNQLKNCNKTLVNTVKLQDSIMVDLKKKLLTAQKENLQKAIEETKVIQSGVKMTQRHATTIKNRQSYNKGILMTLVCILTIGNILYIYFKFVH